MKADPPHPLTHTHTAAHRSLHAGQTLEKGQGMEEEHRADQGQYVTVRFRGRLLDQPEVMAPGSYATAGTA